LLEKKQNIITYSWVIINLKLRKHYLFSFFLSMALEYFELCSELFKIMVDFVAAC